MAGIGIKSDGNGGLHVKKPSFFTVLAVAAALGWGSGDLLMGPTHVREDEQLKATVVHLAKDLADHKADAERRFVAAEQRADKSADKIDERLAEFERRLNAFLTEMARQNREG